MSSTPSDAAPLPATMRAAVAAGGACALTSRPVPTPQGSELLLRVHWTAINRADTLQRKGVYPPPAGSTDILGLEAAGEVVALGPGCVRGAAFPVGARVMALLPGERVG